MFYEKTLNIATNAAGLAIKAAKNAAAKVANTTFFHIDGNMFYLAGKDVAIATDYLGNAITIETDMQCILSVFTDILGAIHVAKGQEYTKHEHYKTDFIVNELPMYALLGYIYIKNEQALAAQFVGGTTALDETGLTVTYSDSYSCLGK